MECICIISLVILTLILGFGFMISAIRDHSKRVQAKQDRQIELLLELKKEVEKDNNE